MKMSPLAGKPAPAVMLGDVPRLVTASYTDTPDPSVPEQLVAFGTSGHRGSALERTFNEWHVLAISHAICEYRARQGTDGPLFLGIDTHALSVPACATALEVLAANGVNVMLAAHDEVTPTRVVSHAILTYNRARTAGLADGIVITQSHNPPDNGGFKYNPPNGGPADTSVTDWIQTRANDLLRGALKEVKRVPYEQALRAATTHRHDYRDAYVRDLGNVIDMDAIRAANIHLGVDPLGGASVHYWSSIAERYGLDLTVIAGASFLRRDGTVWTTDKDGIVAGLLAAEITARGARSGGDLQRSHAGVRRPGGRARRSARHRGAAEEACRALAEAAAQHGAGRGEDREHPRSCARQRRADRRNESDREERLVRRPAIGHGRDLQDLCGELSRRRASGPHRG